MMQYPYDYVLIGGDFNARVSNFGQLMDKRVLFNGNMRRDRQSLDMTHT